MPNHPITNSFKSAEFSVVDQIDPTLIRFYAESLAQQVNDFRMSYKPQKKCKDLTDWIADIILETSAQGASLLEVHVVDPAWTLLMRDSNGVSFIDVDDQGYIWPPVEVTFPKNISDATWRLAQVRPSTSLMQANLVLVFEDKIASELREHSAANGAAVQMSHTGETRAQFIQRIIQDANANPAYPTDVQIKFVPLLPHETFTQADLTMSSLLPTSATQPNPPPARKTHKKTPNKNATKQAAQTISKTVDGVVISILDGFNAFISGDQGQTTANFGGVNNTNPFGVAGLPNFPSLPGAS